MVNSSDYRFGDATKANYPAWQYIWITIKKGCNNKLNNIEILPRDYDLLSSLTWYFLWKNIGSKLDDIEQWENDN